MAKKIFFPIVLILPLLLSFWLGKVTGQRGKNTESGSHTEASSVATKSVPETASHEHPEGKADEHSEGKEPVEGFKLTTDERQNIGLKIVVADLRPIESVVRLAGIVKPHPDKEAQVSSRVSGKIVGLFAKTGDPVQKGQRLAEVQSAEIQKLQVDLLQAENRLVLHKAGGKQNRRSKRTDSSPEPTSGRVERDRRFGKTTGSPGFARKCGEKNAR